ncbi:MAG TPA: sugar-binding transcriptional regulator [Firmicutes bacterium]|nr:sugar-binding transcriptional regulator [Bacillota bacterium]
MGIVDSDEFCGRVARLYYGDELTQAEIAELLGVSRSVVSRCLSRARARRLVQIEVFDPEEVCRERAEIIRQLFGLRHVVVVPNTEDNDDEEAKRAVSDAAALYLDSIVRDGSIIAVSWGTTMYEVAKRLIPRKLSGVKVVQLNGNARSSRTHENAATILMNFAQAYSAEAYSLPVPAVTHSKALSSQLLADPAISLAIDLARRAEIAVFSIGFPDARSILVESGYVTVQEIAELVARGAVGDVCSRYFGANGEIIDPDLDARTIGIGLSDLRDKAHSIGVAAGAHKARGIVGAARGGYVNTLIVDELAALEMMRLV